MQRLGRPRMLLDILSQNYIVYNIISFSSNDTCIQFASLVRRPGYFIESEPFVSVGVFKIHVHMYILATNFLRCITTCFHGM